MKARHIFGIILRTVGLFILLVSIWHLAVAVMMTYGRSSYDNGFTYPFDPYFSFIVGSLTLVIGVALLRFARQIVRFCYPKGKDDDDA